MGEEKRKKIGEIIRLNTTDVTLRQHHDMLNISEKSLSVCTSEQKTFTKALTMEVNGSKYRRLFLLKIWHLFIFILFLFNMTAVRNYFEWHSILFYSILFYSILYSLLYCLYEEIFYLLPIKLLHVLQIIIWII